MKIYIYLTITTVILFSCKKNCINPYSSLNGKVKSMTISLQDSSKFNIIFFYDTLTAKITNIKLLRKPPEIDSFGLDAEFVFRYDKNIITIDEIGLDNINIYHQYKIHFDNYKHINAFNTVDVNFNMEAPYMTCIQQGSKIDSFYEKYNWPTAFNRQCYDYVFDGNNYTGFKFEYDWYAIFGGNVHVLDSAKINYANLPFTSYAPMQYMYSANTLFNLGAPGEVFYDILYFLQLEGFVFYTPNRNLVNTIRTFDDSTTIVYMNYDFNSNNQLSKFYVNFRTPSFRFFTYTFEYY